MIRTEDKKYGVVISPKNQLFETRLKLVRLSDIKSSFTPHSDFKQKISLTGKIEDLSIEQLEDKMKKIYEENKVLVEGDFVEIKDA